MATSIREIVTHAGVTKPGLYYYFKNKVSLFQEILNSTAALLEPELAEATEMEDTALNRFT